MTLPNTFANQTSPNMLWLDQNDSALANMAIWNTTATGTNAIDLTTTSNQPAVSAYTDRQRFQFIGPNNSTNSVTVAVNSLSALPLYLPSGSQAESGDIGSGKPYLIIYLAALNSGNGGFQIISSLPSSGNSPFSLGFCRGLIVVNNSSTPNTKIDITANQALMVTTGGTPIFRSAASVTIDLTTTGANGMDTGARPTSGWVYCYLIDNGSVTAGLASATSPTAGAPTLPGGYTYAAYIGAMYCDGSQNLLRSRQVGNRAQYIATASTNTTKPPVMDNGTAGTFSTTNPALKSLTVMGNGAYVPLTASSIGVYATTKYTNGAGADIEVAPSNSYSGTGTGPLGSLGFVWPIYVNNSFPIDLTTEFQLESVALYWASVGAGAAIACQGWTDYYVNA